MAKIHKSPNVYMDSEHKVAISRSGFGSQIADNLAGTDNGSDPEQDESGSASKSFKDIFQSFKGLAGQPDPKTDPNRQQSYNTQTGQTNPVSQTGQKAPAQTQSGQSYASVNRGSQTAREEMSVQQILRKAEDEGERIIAEARQQASQILQQNKLKVMAERQAGYQDGFREGQVAAQVMYEQQLSQIQQSFQEIVKELSGRPEALIAGMEEELLDLALEVAGKVIGLELSRKNKSYQVFLNKSLDRLKKQEKATVYLNEREYQLFVAAQTEIFSDENGSIQFVGDDKLPPGSCVIETARGRFDASANVQLDRIGKAMKT